MAELDPKQAKKLEQAQRAANEAIKDGTDLTRTLGTLLDKQIKSADNYNKIIKNRARVINDIGKSEKGSVSNIRSAFTNQVNILRTQNQMSKSKK